MSKNDKKNASVPEFSMNSDTEIKAKGQDNGFFFSFFSKEDDRKPETAEVTGETAASEEKSKKTDPFETAASEEKSEKTDSFETAAPEEKSKKTDSFETAAPVQVPSEPEREAEVKKTEEAQKDTDEKQSSETAEETEKSADSENESPETASDDGENEKKGGPSGVAYFLKIAGVLTLICSFVALMLATINMITKDTIAENAEKEKTAAVTQIFTEADDAFLFEEHTGPEEIYVATKEDKLYGYCVSVASQGYGGEISMMVGVRYDGKIEGVKIVSMSETAGLGSKTKNDSFLGQYADKKGPFTVGDNVDAVAGATISSKAVTEGVNAALNLGLTPESVANAGGIALYGQEPVSSETAEDTDSETEAQPQDTTAAQGEDVTSSVMGVGTTGAEETHIDPSSVGQYKTAYYYQKDDSYTWSRENGHYLEKETTDTESDTSVEAEAEV